MIKNLKIELSVVGVVFLIILFSFSFDEAFNKYFINPVKNEYLKYFFINITEVGSSVWFFLASSLGFVIFFILEKKHKNEFFKKINIFFLFLFTSILVAGAITQIIKHLVGRPRPNHATDSNFGVSNLLNFDSSFHSFPSGHTSTIFAVALSLAILTPRLKNFYLFCATIIGISRVYVGAHYLTDVIGGIAVAYIGIKLTQSFFYKLDYKIYLQPLQKINSDNFYLILITFFVLSIYLGVGSSLDIYISNLFYLGNSQFLIQDYYLISIVVRKVFLFIILFYILILPFISCYLPIKKVYLNFVFNIKEIIFVFVTTLFNLLIVVNMLLKNLWGRARPNDIYQLGGQDIFTPWFKYSEACYNNCSFVSGDASVGFSLIIIYFITKNKFFLWFSLFAGFLIGAIRILEGGHFFSDIVVAGLIVFILSFFQHQFYKKIYTQ
ncbi:phosphatase PAP2 family protein [Alphaproteobacteria bacterium]|nr:phosphatase PAP2 family protein [Alphaproteobacteria bacterium]